MIAIRTRKGRPARRAAGSWPVLQCGSVMAALIVWHYASVILAGSVLAVIILAVSFSLDTRFALSAFTTNMNPVKYIRTEVFGVSQSELARLLGRHHSRVNRWERAGYFPTHVQMRVRKLAMQRGIDWQDSWFFEIPTEHP